MNNWAVKKLGEVCNITTGKLNANAAVEDGKYPFFTCSREIFAINQFAFDCEAVLLAGNNAVGDFNVKHYRGKFNAYQRTYVITIKREQQILYRYLYLQVENGLKEFKSKSVGAGTKFLKLDIIKGLDLPMPPLSQQKRIVSIVDQAFEGIDRAIANTQKNLTNARELFESYLNAIFTQKGSEWEEKKLGEICDLISGQHIDAKDYNTDSKGIAYLTGPSDFGTIHPKISKWTEVPKKTALRNDVLITVKGSGVGKINLLDSDEVAISRQLMALRAKGQNIWFIYAFLSRQYSYFQSLANGAAIPGISRSDVLHLKIPVPSLDVQEQVVTDIDQYHAATQRLEDIYQRKLIALNELKQSILQKAFTGELTADTANQATKAVKEVIAA